MGKSEVRLNSLFSVLSEELSHVSTNEGWKAFAIERQIKRMRKRAKITQKGLREKAVADFCDANNRVGNHTITLPEEIVANARYFITVVLERFFSRFSELNVQESLDLRYLFEQWRFGPGASNGVRGTHTAQKIEQAMSCTVPCVPLILSLRRQDPHFFLHDKLRKEIGYVEVDGSRLTTVPKNEDTERTIAIEPSGNMALQLAAGRALEDVLRMIGLDISTQQAKNNALALRGSIDGSVATLDLKSASDLISTDLVRLLMPTKWYELLMTLRSPVTKLPSGEVVELNMISTMGNGTTFPLMTFLIVSLLYGFRCTRRGPTLRIDWTSTAVFGDDVIIPTAEYSGFCTVLEQAGFLVNHEKSYSEGPFRESCGGDFYMGWDVTPFYVKDLSSDSTIYSAINQVLSWCEKTKIYLFATLELLVSLLKRGPYFIPEWYNPDQGILTSGCARKYSYLKPVQEFKELKDSFYAMKLAAGGYVEARKTDFVYFLPRPLQTRYKVRHGRLPRGYLSGWDPIKRTLAVSTFIESICSFLSVAIQDANG